MTILHTGIKAPAALHPAVVAWYEAALAPLGYTKAVSFLDDQVVGFADAAGEVDWYVSSAAAVPPGVPAPAEGDADVAKILGTHTAFGAKGSYFFHLVSLIFSRLSRRTGRVAIGFVMLGLGLSDGPRGVDSGRGREVESWFSE
jgi:hypothetical protein